MIPASAFDISIFVRLRGKLNAELKDAENTIAKASERMNKRLRLSMKLAGGGAAAAGIAFGVRRMASGFTDSIRAVEKAKGELATLGVEDLGVVVNRARQMQAQVAGITADAFVRASYDIKSGISSLTDEGVAEMTASALLVSKATKGMPEQMTSLFATSYGIFKKQFAEMGDAEFGEMFGATLAKAVQQFKTDGGKMQQAIESAGAFASNMGMGLQEQMAVLGMLQTSMQAGESGTALRAFAENAAQAQEAFADLADDASNPVRVRIVDEKGALRSMSDIMVDLKERYGETLDAFEMAEIKKAFGTTEALKLINTLYGQEAAIQANTEALAGAAQQGNEFTQEMANAADNNFDSAMLLMAQKADVLKQKIGDRLLPVINRFIPVVDAIIASTFAWIDANPELVTTIGAVVAGIGGIAAVMAPVLIASSALVGSFGFLSYGATRLGLTGIKLTVGIAKLSKGMFLLGGKALPLVGKSILFIGRALMANPLGLAIAAIAGGAALIYTYWEPITDFFGNLWDTVKDAGRNAWEGIKATLMQYSGARLIARNWSNITGWFAGIWGGIKGGVSWAWDGIKLLFLNYTPAGMIYSNWSGIVDWFGSLWGRVKAKFSEMWGKISAEVATWPAAMQKYGADLIDKLIAGIVSRIPALGKAMGAVRAKATFNMPGVSDAPYNANPTPNSNSRNDALNDLYGLDGSAPGIQRRAKGGGFGPGFLLTGEEGPELEYRNRGGYIAHNGALRGMVAMARRARDLANGVGMGGGLRGLANAIPNAGSALATAGAVGAGAITYAPTYHMPITLGSGADLEEVRAMMQATLAEHEERAQVDLRRLLND